MEADRADGGSRTDSLKEALLHGHFVGGRHIGEPDVLVELGVAAGLSPDEVRDAVDSAELDEAVDRDIAEGVQLGVRGVPFFVFGNKYGVSGAQPPEVFTQALETLWEESSPLITLDGKASGNALLRFRSNHWVGLALTATLLLESLL